MATLRSETAGLVRLAADDLAAIWRILERGEGDARTVLNDLLPGLIAEYGAMGAAVAADWCDVYVQDARLLEERDQLLAGEERSLPFLNGVHHCTLPIQRA